MDGSPINMEMTTAQDPSSCDMFAPESVQQVWSNFCGKMKKGVLGNIKGDPIQVKEATFNELIQFLRGAVSHWCVGGQTLPLSVLQQLGMNPSLQDQPA